jgi:hypothetical protein
VWRGAPEALAADQGRHLQPAAWENMARCSRYHCDLGSLESYFKFRIQGLGFRD